MRTPLIAGTWYPADTEKLSGLMDSWKSSEPVLPHPSVLVVPHAGYAYSGALAAAAYSRLPADGYDQVIVLAPSHHAALPRQVSVEPAGEVMTPFGPVTFDSSLHDALLSLPHATSQPSVHMAEHSIDIQLPMIRRFLPGCRLGALLVGYWDCVSTADMQTLAAFGRAFRTLLTPRTLVVISSDFTHYGRSFGYVPFTEHVPENLARLDGAVFQALASNDNRRFAAVLHQTRATVCGASAMHLVLAALPEKAVFTQLDYDTSGRMTHDWSQCVSYLTAMIQTDWSLPMKTQPREESEAVSPAAASALLAVARHVIQRVVNGMKPDISTLHIAPDILAELQQHRGAFVTLNEHGQLRGCIGEILPERPLLQVVMDRAVSAALHDTRFHPVRPDELEALDLEVSVLTPPKPIASASDIVIGEHGVILQKNGRTAVFLPQVAPEQGWDVPTMLAHLSLKAGLPADAWRSGATFFVFTAQILHEL